MVIRKRTRPLGSGASPSKTTLGSYVRERRLALGIGQVQLATQCGLAQNQISRIEIGTTKHIDDNLLIRLATALKCDVDELRQKISVKPVNNPTTEFGKFVRARREALGMTVEGLAKKLKMTLQQARYLEIRRSPSIRYSLVNKLVKALDLAPSDLIKFVGSAKKETTSELGQLIRARRKELGLSIEALAKKVNVSRQFVNQIEFGQVRLSTNDGMIARLARALKLDVKKLEELRQKRRLFKPVHDSKSLGAFLAAKRLELGLTQRELSERAGFSTTIVSSLENGRLRASNSMISALQKALHCQIPQELIPPPLIRKNDYFKSVVAVERKGLGKLVTERRLELRITQAQLAKRVGVTATVISCIERDRHRLCTEMATRLAKALECEIPVEFISTVGQRKVQGLRRNQEDPSPIKSVRLSDKHFAEVLLMKESLGVRTNYRVVEKAIDTLRMLLEQHKDGYAIFLHKGGIIKQLELCL